MKQAWRLITTIIYGSLSCLCFDTTNALAPSFRVQNFIHEAASQSSRREASRRAFLLAPVVAAVASVARPGPADALESCRPKSHNCIRTAWIAPYSTSLSGAVETIRDVLNSYPQTGQAGADCSGWRIVRDGLDGDGGTIALEYKSCVGPAALAINLGQPFVDDLKVELTKAESGKITAEVKSSSRMGSSDLFVNRKRLQYLGRRLKERGWDVPDPKYGYEM